MNIVLVEDNDDLRDLLCRDISKAGYAVAQASCAEDLDDIAAEIVFSIMILDINLPGENGYSIARRFRQSNPNLYIIMLTVRDDLTDRVTGYGSGADLYLPKPVASAELIAAIQGIERRIATAQVQAAAVLNIRAMTLTLSSTVSLNRLEVILLKALSESGTGSLPYFRLIELCGDEVSIQSKATLEVRFVRLRRKMLEAGLGEYAIKAQRNEGYQLTAHVCIVPA